MTEPRDDTPLEPGTQPDFEAVETLGASLDGRRPMTAA